MKKVLAGAIALTASAGVFAAPIAVWEITSTTMFDGDASNFEAAPNDPVVTPSRLSWSDTAGSTSSLSLGDGTGPDGFITTSTVNTIGVGTVMRGDDGTIGQASQLTHANVPVVLSQTAVLQNSVLMTVASFTPDGETDPVLERTLSIDFLFDETLNAGVNGVCGDNETPPPGGCSDLFIADLADFTDTFDYLGDTYTASFFPEDPSIFSVLSEGECLAAGAAASCVGFETLEGQNTTVSFLFDVEVAAVPLPPAVVLFASGLVGAGFIARRRRAA